MVPGSSRAPRRRSRVRVGVPPGGKRREAGRRGQAEAGGGRAAAGRDPARPAPGRGPQDPGAWPRSRRHSPHSPPPPPRRELLWGREGEASGCPEPAGHGHGQGQDRDRQRAAIQGRAYPASEAPSKARAGREHPSANPGAPRGPPPAARPPFCLLRGTSAWINALLFTSAERLPSGGGSEVGLPRGLRASFRAPRAGEAHVRLLRPPRHSEDWRCPEPRTSSPLQVLALGAGAERPDWRWPASWENPQLERLPAPGRREEMEQRRWLPSKEASPPFCLKKKGNSVSGALGRLAQGTWYETYRLGPARKTLGE